MTWTPADDHRPADETRAITRATTAATDVDRLLTNDGATAHQALALMRTWADTGMRAASTDPSTGPPPMWCDRHQQDRRRCKVPELCPGHPYQPGADPVGELATDRRDQAAADRRDFLRLLETRARTDERLAQLAAGYRAIRPKAATGPGSGYCASCYRWKATLTEVSLRPDGRARYAGLCKRCGEFRSAYQQLPPLAVLEAWHTPGMRATKTLIDRALKGDQTPAKTRHQRRRSKDQGWTPR